ncbi:hypothetical protein MLD38_010677 [Melastoma candidum]|uniref:Uncharacterized protein n=1 Tax=Melastoma candidum TaxID=119954 RepID=A0ACB9R076_9MYRT|nr:hypothetical protein MLD38_010677 [Melastoma candidum]
MVTEEEEEKAAMVVVVVVGLIVLQLVYSANSIVLSYLMSLRLNPLAFAVTSSLATFVVLCPFAYVFERRLWPRKLGLKLAVQLVFAAIGGVTLFQTLFVKGIGMTSAAMGTAMPNLSPGLIFIIAWITRLEKVDLGCIYSKVKILGTIFCVLGAVILSLMHSTTGSGPQRTMPSAENSNFDKEKIVGCLYLLAAILAQSSVSILQAITLIELPAPMSICAITSLTGALTTSLLMPLDKHGFEMGGPSVSFERLVGFSFLVGSMGAGCLSFNVWAIKKRGPVFASIFSPISTVCSFLFSVATSQETITLPSLGGMTLMFAGLYLFLWSKGKESCPYSTAGSGAEGKHPLLC